MTDNLFPNLKGKKVLVTGHTGFKGSWLSLWLKKIGADVTGLALDPSNKKDNFNLAGVGAKIKDLRGDIRDASTVKSAFTKSKAEIVFHLAAQPLVLDSYENPEYTIEVNTLGTMNMLQAFRESKHAKVMLVITTDKVYDNQEWVWGYRETDPLGGKDIYSASKAAAEIITNSYRSSFFKHSEGKSVASVRAGNVIGGGDWAANRIVPDCIRSLEKKQSIKIRNPFAVRPWQHVLEPLGGYLLLADRMTAGETGLAQAWNFGPSFESIINVRQLAEKVVRYYGSGKLVVEKQTGQKQEANLLALDISKAVQQLSWKPLLTVDESIEWTVEWYKNYSRAGAAEICSSQIEKYEQLWNSDRKI